MNLSLKNGFSFSTNLKNGVDKSQPLWYNNNVIKRKERGNEK